MLTTATNAWETLGPFRWTKWKCSPIFATLRRSTLSHLWLGQPFMRKCFYDLVLRDAVLEPEFQRTDHRYRTHVLQLYEWGLLDDIDNPLVAARYFSVVIIRTNFTCLNLAKLARTR